MEKPTDRRSFLRFGLGGAGALVFTAPLSKALAQRCSLTPPQTEGPFYPGERNFTQENDLTSIKGSRARAKGQVIYVKGRVLDQSCRPIEGANVEIWQACASGRYNSPKDPNRGAPLDPNFRYWAEVYTDENGQYIFKTIIPGAYPADRNWDRPPHIHFKVSKLGYKEVTTQMYFKGQPLNDRDLIIQDLSRGERESVIVDFKRSATGFEPRSLTGVFDISLKSVR